MELWVRGMLPPHERNRVKDWTFIPARHRALNQFTDAGAATNCRECGQKWDYNIERESMTWLPSPGASSKGPITRSPFHQVKYSYARLDGEPGMPVTKSACPRL